jgi:UDP-glucose 4-epimerase
MTVLVLGGSGFIGSKLISELIKAGETVIATRRRASVLASSPNLFWYQIDLAEFQDWDMLLQKVSVVYHLAWSTIPATADVDPSADNNANVKGSLRLLEALRAHRNVRLVFTSSGGTVYGRLSQVPAQEDHPTVPIGVYGQSKLTVEQHIAWHASKYGLDAVVLRLSNPFGLGQWSGRLFGAVSTFCVQAKSRQVLKIFGDGTVVRDYFYIDDAISALRLAAACRSQLRTFNIGSGHGRSLNEVIKVIEAALETKLAVQFEPQRNFDVPVSVLDVTRARSILGWQPRISFAEGVARVLADAADEGALS